MFHLGTISKGFDVRVPGPIQIEYLYPIGPYTLYWWVEFDTGRRFAPEEVGPKHARGRTQAFFRVFSGAPWQFPVTREGISRASTRASGVIFRASAIKRRDCDYYPSRWWF